VLVSEIRVIEYCGLRHRELNYFLLSGRRRKYDLTEPRMASRR
jgi:hypothetical protein